METATTIRGRALHPLLVPVPLGAFATSLVLDVLHVATGDATWYEAAFVATAFGAAALAVAVVPAVVDYARSLPRAGAVRKVAMTHMALGGALVGYWIASAAVRWDTLGSANGMVAVAALAFNVAGHAAVVVQGYLGGQLVKRHRVGVTAPPASATRPSDAGRVPWRAR